MIKRILKHEPPAWLLVTAIIFFMVVLSAGASLSLFNSAYQDKIYPGVYVGNIDLSGKNADEAYNTINDVLDSYRESGLVFAYQTRKTALPMDITNDAGEVIGTLIDFDTDKMVSRAIGYGREADIFTNAAHQLNALATKHYIMPNYVLNESGIKSYLNDSFKTYIKMSEPAKLTYANSSFKIEAEKPGIKFDLDGAIKPLEELVSHLDTGEIELNTSVADPSITKNQLDDIIGEANDYIRYAPLTLNYQKKKWSVKKDDLAKWLSISNISNTPSLVLNRNQVMDYLNRKVAPDVEIKVTEARFIIKNGKATAFSTAKDGLAIDATTTLSNITNDWLSNRLSSTSIALSKVVSQLATTSTNDLGITELIGVGTSNFSGSSASRKKNIRIGMSYLNGLLIPPGQTFSVMRNLGSIDGSKGYVEELVIKKDKTQKEFGGGLCQIGTTVFRAALNSGLPIVERHNHSYRVSYYEPAGTDATIYDPSPDLKFTNDTASYILIQASMSGNILTFEFWGTKDGREAKQTYPKITKIVKPAPAKLIETLSLKPGEKKCTEKAHNGADSSFSYTVTYPNGEVKNKVFYSHYVPWQEVCLIGVKSLSDNPVSTGSDNTTNTSAGTSTPIKTIPTTASTTTATKPTASSSTNTR